MAYAKNKGKTQNRKPSNDAPRNDDQPSVFDEAKEKVAASLDRSVVGAWSKRKKGNLRWETEKEAVLRAIIKTEKAARAALNNPGSVVLAMLDCASLGLTLHHTLGYAYLTPETIGGKMAISLTVGYKGLEQLALRSKTVTNIATELVYEKDSFRRGMNRDGSNWVEFEPARGDRGRLEGGYCRAILANGTMHVEWMTGAEIDACEAAAEDRNGGGGWKGPFYGEFQKKSIVRRASKHWELEGDLAEELKILDRLEPMNFDNLKPRESAPPAEETVTVLSAEHRQEIINKLGNEYDISADKVGDWIEKQCEAWGHPAGSKTFADAGWEKLYEALKGRAERVKKAREEAPQK